MNIGAIAQALGYHDLFLFSRQFKTCYGYPLSQVRARRRAIKPFTIGVQGFCTPGDLAYAI